MSSSSSSSSSSWSWSWSAWSWSAWSWSLPHRPPPYRQDAISPSNHLIVSFLMTPVSDWCKKRMEAIIALTLLSTLIALRVHVEPTSKVFLYSNFGCSDWNFCLAVTCEASNQTVFFAQNRMRTDFELPGSCHAVGPLSMWTSSVQIYKGLVEPKGPVEVAVVEVNSVKRSMKSLVSMWKAWNLLKFDVTMPLEVSLRDDPSIRGICKQFAGTEAQNLIEKEVPVRWNSELGIERISISGSL